VRKGIIAISRQPGHARYGKGFAAFLRNNQDPKLINLVHGTRPPLLIYFNFAEQIIARTLRDNNRKIPWVAQKGRNFNIILL
jgi:hypothetical protein